MLTREKIKSKIKYTNWKLRHKLDSQEENTHSFHSFSYHRHFEGYTECRQKNAKGKVKLVRKYNGAWYRQDLSNVRYILLRLGYIGALEAIIALFVSTATMGGMENTPWYLTISELITIFFLTAAVYTLLVNYVFAPKKMTIGDYKSSSRSWMLVAKGMAICFGVNALFLLLCMATGQFTDSTSGMFSAGMMLLAGLLSLALWQVELRVPYKTTEGRAPTEEDGVEITA
ncbi:MAG: hypothetical protein LUF92_15620 [Clostridiales bacterium]|nr:hypothetical protein [Clostridiales bacterium]